MRFLFLLINFIKSKVNRYSVFSKVTKIDSRITFQIMRYKRLKSSSCMIVRNEKKTALRLRIYVIQIFSFSCIRNEANKKKASPFKLCVLWVSLRHLIFQSLIKNAHLFTSRLLSVILYFARFWKISSCFSVAAAIERLSTFA